jgi:hypothetical protein
MSEKESQALVPSRGSHELEKSITSFSPAVAGFLNDVGLPTENILSPVEERRKVINELENALSILPEADREKAFYLTKFTVAIAVGLFDGALNYLWDETISAFRRLVRKVDLAYFFAVAATISSRNKNFSSAEDLDQVADHDLPEACRRIGLLSDVNYKRIEHVNYMRNHASAAHPNENDLDGYEMLSWLSTCLKHAITAEPDHSVISIKMLLVNMRSETIPPSDIPLMGADLLKLSQERIDDLVWTLFGMYVDPRQTPTTRTNIQNLAPQVWPSATDDRKYDIGSRFGVFRNNADIQRKDSAQAFLEAVGGLKYKDEDSLAGELIDKLGLLKSVHFGINNFYNEYPRARALEQSLPRTGVVPRAARSLWVKVVAICYVGNGAGYWEGVDEGALPYYIKYVENFSDDEMVEFIRLFEDPEFTSALDRRRTDKRTRELATRLKSKTKNLRLQDALNLIIDAPDGTLYGLSNTSAFKRAIKDLR